MVSEEVLSIRLGGVARHLKQEETASAAEDEAPEFPQSASGLEDFSMVNVFEVLGSIANSDA